MIKIVMDKIWDESRRLLAFIAEMKKQNGHAEPTKLNAKNKNKKTKPLRIQEDISVDLVARVVNPALHRWQLACTSAVL